MMGAPLTEVERNRIGKLFDALKKKYSKAECNWQWNRSITIEKFIAYNCELQVNLGRRPRVVYFTLYARTPDGGNEQDRQKVMEWVNDFRRRYKKIRFSVSRKKRVVIPKSITEKRSFISSRQMSIGKFRRRMNG